MLQIRGLKKSFKRPVVQGVDLDVGPGEVVGLLGPNGAGKTTTFRMSMGMIRPDSGSVRFLEHEVTDWPLFRDFEGAIELCIGSSKKHDDTSYMTVTTE